MAGLFNLSAFEVTPTLIESPYSTEVVEDWSNPKYTALPFKVHCEPVESLESSQGADTPWTIERYRVICPPGKTVTLGANSRLYVTGFTKAPEFFHVVGEPGTYNTPFLKHTEFIVERVGGNPSG